MNPSGQHGLLVLDKPPGITSRAAVTRAQGWFPRGTRLGHTGTLDPLATGVLVLMVGAATRLGEYVQRMAKTYRTSIHLGATSATDDAEGEVTPVPASRPPDRDGVEAVVQSFIGEFDQIPPAYSAAKAAGRRAYARARRGEEVALAPRRVRVEAIRIEAYQYPLLELEVRCGKGTYIRALARDIGDRLGCGGYVASLRRTCVGPFRAEEALALDADTATARGRLLPMALAVSELPHRTLDGDAIERLRNGRMAPVDGVALNSTQEVAVFDRAGNFVLVATCDSEQPVLRPRKVLPS
jgi:tRNA pseudouridine55 synthase